MAFSGVRRNNDLLRLPPHLNEFKYSAETRALYQKKPLDDPIRNADATRFLRSGFLGDISFGCPTSNIELPREKRWPLICGNGGLVLSIGFRGSNAKKSEEKGPGIFISHSSANLEDAKQIEAALNAGGFDVWLDDSAIRVGVLLGKELLEAIEASRAVVLIWSEAAKNSAWVTTEILAAFHLNRFILPYTLDATEFPQLLSRSIHGNLRKERAATFTKLVQDVKRAPRSRNEFPGVTAYQPPELEKTSRELNDAQMAVLGRVDDNDLVGAAKLQEELDD